MKQPFEVIRIAGDAAVAKSGYSVRKTLVLAFLAGAYIAMGGALSLVAGGGVPAISAENPAIGKLLLGATFPVGLMIVVLTGAELFTGNNAYFMPNVLSGSQSWSEPLRNWVLVYLGNFFGAVFVAYFVVHHSGIVSQEPWTTALYNISLMKTESSFLTIFIKGIGANWLVCLALWMAMASPSASGKILALWWPIMTFVTLGFEHSIANMFFIPLAIFEGASITWNQFLVSNLIPSTLGNIVGGALFVGTLHWYAFEKLQFR